MRAFTDKPLLADVLFGKTRTALLALFLQNPESQFYYRQITRQLNEHSSGTLQRELKLLERVGLIRRVAIGRQVFYSANREHPLFPELRSLIAKTAGIFHLLASAFAKIADQTDLAFVYGSVAAGSERPGSDVDLLVVGTATMDQVIEVCATVEPAIGRAVNPTVYSNEDFKAKLKARNHFLLAILRGPKVFLIGDGHELAKVG